MVPTRGGNATEIDAGRDDDESLPLATIGELPSDKGLGLTATRGSASSPAGRSAKRLAMSFFAGGVKSGSFFGCVAGVSAIELSIAGGTVGALISCKAVACGGAIGD